jgi:hypothetical protein
MSSSPAPATMAALPTVTVRAAITAAMNMQAQCRAWSTQKWDSRQAPQPLAATMRCTSQRRSMTAWVAPLTARAATTPGSGIGTTTSTRAKATAWQAR